MSEPAEAPATRTILSASWQCFARNWGPLFAAYLVYFFLVNLGVTILFIGPLTVGLCRMSLCAVRGEAVAFDDYFDAFKDFMPALIAGLAYVFAGMLPWMVLALCMLTTGMLYFANGDMVTGYAVIVGGATLALLPMLTATVLYTPAFFILCDRKVTGIEALRESAALVRPKWSLWTGLWTALGVIHLAGSLLCCLPSFIVTPWMFVALGYLYDQQTRAQAREIPALPG